MAEERFLIEIILDAQSKVAPVMQAVVAQTEKMEASLRKADGTVRQLDTHLEQLDGHIAKARDTLRSMNPTLDATDRKFKGLSGTLTGVNSNMRVLERTSAKAGAALGGLSTLVDRIEKRLAKLDAKMTEMGAKTYKPEMDVETGKSEAKVDALIAKLASATRGRHTAQTDVEIGASLRKIEALREQLSRAGFGDRADNLILQIIIDEGAETEEELRRIALLADEASRKRDLEFTSRGNDVVKAQIEGLIADAKRLAQTDVGIKAFLDQNEFKRQYREIQARIVELASTDAGIDVDLDTKGFDAHLLELKARLAELGLKEEHVRVVLDVDRGGFDRFIGGIEDLSKEAQFRFDGLSTKIRDNVIGLAIVFAEPLLSALTAVGGALIAVGVAAGEAAFGLAGLATAGIAQAIPVLGLLFAAISRVTAVFKAVSAVQAEKDKGAQQGARGDQQQASAANALKNAQRSLLDAYQNLLDAQIKLNEARREGVRTITDQIIAEQRANLSATTSRLSLAAQIGSGGGGLIQSAQLQARTDTIGANRQQVDTSRTVTGGIDKLPAVVSASKAVDQASESVDRAKEAVKQAEEAFKNAAASEGAAASALAVAMGKLTDAEKTLFDSVQRFRGLFEKGGAFSGVTDVLVSGFAKALDQITDLLKDPALIAAAGNLATAMSAGLLDFIHFLTTGKVHDAFLFFASEAAKNIGPFTEIVESLVDIFTDVAKAASGPLSEALDGVAGFLKSISDYTGSDKGQSALGKFFQDALAPIESFLKLGGAVLELFLALVGVGVGKEGTKGIDGLTKSVQGATKYVRENGDKVREFFGDAVDAAGKLLGVVIHAGGLLVKAFDADSVKDLAKALNNVVLPAMETFITTIGAVSLALLDIANNPAGGFLIKMGALFLGVNVVVSGLVRLLGPLALIAKGLRFLLGIIYETRIGFIVLTASFEAMEAALAVLSGPVGWIILAVAALTLLLAKLGVLDDVIDWLKVHWPLVVEILSFGTATAVIVVIKNFGKIKDGIEDALDAVKKIITSATSWVVDKLTSLGEDVVGILPSPFKRAGKSAADGFISGLKSIGDFFANIGVWLFDHVIKPFYDYFEIKSPSKLMERMGRNVGQGLVNGIVGFVEGYYGSLFALGRKIVEAVVEGIKSLAGAIADALKEAASGRVEIFGHNINPLAKGGGGGGDKPPPAAPPAATTPGAPKSSVDIGLDAGNQKKFAADWKDFWSDLVTTSQRGAARIATSFKDLRVASTNSTEKMYVDVRSNLADTQNSFEVRGAAIESAWSDAFFSISKIAYDGLFYIGHETNRALTGLGSKTIDFNLTGPTHDKAENKASGGLVGLAAGFSGWVGQQGERGADKVHAVLGRGEAVLNWAHQRVVEPAMRAVYGMGLTDMFRGTRAMHAGTGDANAYASGGFSNSVGAHIDTADEKEIATDLGRLGRKLNVVFSPAGPRSARRTAQENAEVDGAPGSKHLLGKAMDVAPEVIKSVANSVLNAFGLNRPMPGVWTSPTGGVHDERNHIELLDGGSKSALGSLPDVASVAANAVATSIGRVLVGGNNKSGVGSLVQKSIDTARDAANKHLKAGSSDDPIGDLTGFKAVGSSIKANMTLARTMLAASSLNAPGAWDALKYVWGHESGFDETVHYGGGHGYVPGLAYGIPQARPGDKMVSAGADWESNPATQIKWGLGYIKSVYHSMATLLAHWKANASYAGGGIVGGIKAAWGGAQAKGGTYQVDKPTLFLAGDAGREVAHFAPGGFTSGTSQITTGGASNIRTQLDASKPASLINAIASASTFRDASNAAQTVFLALQNFSIKTATSLKKFAHSIDELGLNDPIDLLLSRVDAASAARRSRGLDEAKTLGDRTQPLEQTLGVDNGLIKRTQQALRKATQLGDEGSAQILQGRLNQFLADRTTVQQAITDNATAIFTQAQAVFDRASSTITRRQKQNTALGVNDPNLIQEQADNAGREIGALTGQLANAKKKGNKQLAQQIEDKIADLNESIVELGVQKVQALLDNVNKAATDRNAGIDRRFAAGTILGIAGTAQAKLGQQSASASQQIGDLTSLIGPAAASGNQQLVATIQAQIEELNNSLVQYVHDTIQAGIDDVNKRASSRLGINDIQNSLAQLGVSQDQARNGTFNIAALGRPNYQAIGSGLNDRTSILKDQRSGLLDQLRSAVSTGDVGLVSDLTKQIGDLDVSIVQNTQAVRDNTDAAFNAAITQSQSSNDFLLSLNTGAQGINTSLVQLNGTQDTATQKRLLGQRDAEQMKSNNDNKGFLGTLLGGIGIDTSQLGSVSGNDLVPYLTQLYTQGIASGQLDDTQIQTLKDLITAIIGGEQATIDNTAAIKGLDGTFAQTFSSTAFKTFRQSIFDGNGGLLGPYNIPSMGTFATSGIAPMMTAERELASNTSTSSGGGGVHIEEFNTNITNPTQVLDESVVGKKIAWNITGIGKDN